MEAKIDPLKVLDLPKNYNADMLKENYKRLALKAHPDKGGSEYLFKLLTECYRYLAKELKKKEADKQFHELKQEFMSELEKSKQSNRTSRSRTNQTHNNAAGTSSGSASNRYNEPDKQSIENHFYNGSRFDQEKFNRFFMDNKLTDEVMEQGYKEWMDKAEAKEAPKFRGSFNSQGFNNHFEQHARADTNHKQLIKYQEPEALVTSKRLGFTELGQESIDDFSGDNKSLKNLNYTDYRIAHTTSRIVDPRTVNRQDFKNIQELERSRDNISFQMTEEDHALYDKKKRQQEKLEEQRQRAQQQFDQRALQNYQRLNGLLTMGGNRR